MDVNGNSFPSRAPWFGAIWETMIGIMKAYLKKVVGRVLLLFMTTTVLAEVESVVNSQPSTYVSRNLNENDELCPNHLLYGGRLREHPPPDNFPELANDPNYGEIQALSSHQSCLRSDMGQMESRVPHSITKTSMEHSFSTWGP